MKSFRLNATIAAATISLVSGFQFQAFAFEPDYLCFVTTGAGEVLDLSQSLCTNKSATSSIATLDKAFIEAYKNQAMQYADVRDNLLAKIQQSPEANIAAAKGVCNDLEAGISLEEIQEHQSEGHEAKADEVNSEIVNRLATQYYCPGV
jgi:hypothetical protein